MPEELSEDYWMFPKTFEDDPKKFQSYTNKFEHSLRAKHDISEVIIFTSQDIHGENTPPVPVMFLYEFFEQCIFQ